VPTAYVLLAQAPDSDRPEIPAIVTLSVRDPSARPGLFTKSVAAAIAETHPTAASRRVSDEVTRTRSPGLPR
jgi:hypothetical protein